MKKILLIIAFSLIFAATASAAQATLLSVHGFVKDSTTGTPIASGNIMIDVCTDSGGTTCLLTGGETFNNTINQGAFDVLVGSTKTLSLNFNDDYYMKVLVNGTQVGNTFKFRGGQGQIGPNDIDTTATYTVGGLNAGSISTSLVGIASGIIAGMRGMARVYTLDNDGNIWARSSMTTPEIISTGGITLGGVRKTTWPDPGTGNIVDTLLETLTAGSNAASFTGTTTIGGPFISNTSVTSPELISTGGITLGGTRRTNWQALDCVQSTKDELCNVGSSTPYCYAMAECPGNYVVTGGGCSLVAYGGGDQYSVPLNRLAPLGNTAWTCTYVKQAFDIRVYAYARCCRLT
ncbi:MAG: hypothetical protein AB1467_03455 [Candidatus Diapherotrites archaeon]